MEMNDLQVALPTTSESSTPKYTFKRPYPQCFSLPYTIIKYMIQNPQSGKVWKKLIMSCKYFYSKYPVFPVKCLNVICELKCKADGEYFDSSKPFPKLWVYDYFSSVMDSNVSTVISKIFKFDLCSLYLDDENLTFNEYQKLTSSGSVKELCLLECKINNADGTTVTTDKLIENLHHLEEFTLCAVDDASMFRADTVKKMVHHFNGVKKMRSLFFYLTESFDFASFADFLLKNENANVNFYYFGHVSDAYKEMVENVQEEININPALKVPVIYL